MGLDLFRRSVLEWGFSGMKLYPPMGFSLLDETLEPYLEICAERRLPVLTHSGPSLPALESEFARPVYVQELARAHPELRLVIAHGGYSIGTPEVRRAVEADNVMVDVSGFQAHSASVGWDRATRDLGWVLEPDFHEQRVLFGTDFPLFHFAVGLKHDLERICSVFESHGSGDRSKARERAGWQRGAPAEQGVDGSRDEIVSTDDQVSLVQSEDLDAVMALVDEEGWRGYSVADLAIIMRISPENCFKLVVGDRLVGASFALTVAEISYLSFFLIDRGHRSLQSARALGLRCLSAAWERSRLVVAYANRRAVRAYARTGFRTAHWVTRYQATLVDSSASSFARPFRHQPGRRGGGPRHGSAVLWSRPEGIVQRPSLSTRMAASTVTGRRGSRGLAGYAFVRKCSNEYLIGPIVAVGDAIASSLVLRILTDLPTSTASLEVNKEGLPQSRSFSIRFERTAVSVRKMYVGSDTLLEENDLLYAIGGHHFS